MLVSRKGAIRRTGNFREIRMTLGWAGSNSRDIDCPEGVHIKFHVGTQPWREQLLKSATWLGLKQ